MYKSINQGKESPRMEAHLQDCKKQVNSVEGLKKQNDIQMQMDEDIKKLFSQKKYNFTPLTRLIIYYKDFKSLAVFLFFSLTREEISEYINNKKDKVFKRIMQKLKDGGEYLSQAQIDILNQLKITNVQNKNQQTKCLVEQFIRRFSIHFQNGINFHFTICQKIAAVLNQEDCISLLKKIFCNQFPQISTIINKNESISQMYINKQIAQNLQNCVIIKKYSEQDSKIIIYSQIQNRLDLQNQGMTAESKIKLNQKLEKKRSQQYQQQLSKNEQSQQTGFHKKQAISEIQIPTSQKIANPPKPQSQIASQSQTLQHIRDSNKQHSSSDPPAPAKPAISRANTQPISPYHQSQQEAPPYPSPPGSRSGSGSGSGKGSGSGFNRSQSLNNQTILEQRIQIPEKYRLSWFEFAILIIILFAIAGQFGLLDNVLREYNRNVGRYYGIETGYRIGKFFYGKVVDTNATTQL